MQSTVFIRKLDVPGTPLSHFWEHTIRKAGFRGGWLAEAIRAGGTA